jgi:hypothetical protein
MFSFVSSCFQVASNDPATMPTQLINSMMKKLHLLITAKNSRKKHNAAATENAISAFAKAIDFKSACLENERAAGKECSQKWCCVCADLSLVQWKRL